MPLDRRNFVTLGAGALIGVNACSPENDAGALQAQSKNATNDPVSMLKTDRTTGFSSRVITTIGDTIGDYQAPGILDGIGAWRWDAETVRLFVNHELGAGKSYPYQLDNGASLRGARISWFDIDMATRSARAAGNALREIRDRRGKTVVAGVQLTERWDQPSESGLETLCSAQGYAAGDMGFVNDLMFTHEEATANQGHLHGGSAWALDVRSGTLWALPELGRGSWENVTAVATPDQDKPDGHIALLLADDFEFGGAPLYLWIGRKLPDGNFPARNGLTWGQLFVWIADDGHRSPEDWNGTGARAAGRFAALATRDTNRARQPGYDHDGYLNDLLLRKSAQALGAFMLSRPEDLHTNPANASQAVLCSTGHGAKFPADNWGTVYRIDVTIEFDPGNNGDAQPLAAATLQILHDCDDYGDFGIRSPDNVVWASDGMIYIHEDDATKASSFGAQSGLDASTWRLDPDNPSDYERIAVVDRSIVLPADARDMRPDKLGAWECCGLLDVTRQFAAANELLLITNVQAHSIRGGGIGGSRELVQGGQMVLLSRPVK